MPLHDFSEFFQDSFFFLRQRTRLRKPLLVVVLSARKVPLGEVRNKEKLICELRNPEDEAHISTLLYLHGVALQPLLFFLYQQELLCR